MNRREIKFKVWCKENEEFIQFNKMGFWEDGSLWYVQGVDENEEETDPPYFENQNDWELMQYTGLKDKNGVEIYEGDIYRYKYLTGSGVEYRNSVVEWETVGVAYEGVFHGYEFDNYEIEVIGNIYEDKKLLEREAE